MGSEASNAPTASIHIFLSQLSQQKSQTKVRFLGCVLDFDKSTGYLLVEHKYPRHGTQAAVRAYVNVDLVLETTKKDAFASGTWINVIGYVLEGDHAGVTGVVKDSRGSQQLKQLPKVQAVMVWSAGSVHLEEYERVIQKSIDLRTMR